MTIFEQILRDLLIQTNLVGRAVFLMRAPQVPAPELQAPYFVFFPVGPTPHFTHSGPLNQVTRLYQVSIFDTQQTRALAIADSLRQSLDHLQAWFEGVHIGACFFMTQTIGEEPETEMFHVFHEYEITFNGADLANATPSARPNRSNTRKETAA